MNTYSEDKWFDSRLKLRKRSFPVEYTNQNHECFNTTYKIIGGEVFQILNCQRNITLNINNFKESAVSSSCQVITSK